MKRRAQRQDYFAHNSIDLKFIALSLLRVKFILIRYLGESTHGVTSLQGVIYKKKLSFFNKKNLRPLEWDILKVILKIRIILKIRAQVQVLPLVGPPLFWNAQLLSLTSFLLYFTIFH
jgi:hypothetical protein